MGDPEFLRDLLAGEAGIPVVRVYEVVPELPVDQGVVEAARELVEVVVHIFLADESGPTERDPPNPKVGAHVIDFWLVLELSGDNVDRVSEIAELFSELENKNNLSPGVGKS
jgi:hypothetical protein